MLFYILKGSFYINAACSISVDELYSYLELFYARVYGPLIALSFCS